MWTSQCHKPTMTGDGWNPTHKNGDFDDALSFYLVLVCLCRFLQLLSRPCPRASVRVPFV